MKAGIATTVIVEVWQIYKVCFSSEQFWSTYILGNVTDLYSKKYKSFTIKISVPSVEIGRLTMPRLYGNKNISTHPAFDGVI